MTLFAPFAEQARTSSARLNKNPAENTARQKRPVEWQVKQSMLQQVADRAFLILLPGFMYYSTTSNKKLTGLKPSLQDIIAERLFFIQPS